MQASGLVVERSCTGAAGSVAAAALAAAERRSWSRSSIVGVSMRLGAA